MSLSAEDAVAFQVPPGNANPAAHNFGTYHGTWGIAPFVNRTLEWGAVIATFLSVLSVVPRPCARLTCFLHPKLRKFFLEFFLKFPKKNPKNDAVLTTHSQLPFPCGPCGAQDAFPPSF